MLLANSERPPVLSFHPAFNRWKSRVVGLWTALRDHSAVTLAATAAVLAIIALFAATTDKIIVGPFSVPEEYQKRGYTSEAMSSAVVQFIHGNESTVSLIQSLETPSPDSVDGIENLTDYVDGKHVVSSFDQSSIPDIHVPLTSYSLESLVGLLRQTIGRRATQISGEVVALNESDPSGTAAADLQHAKVLIRYTIEYPEPSKPILGFHWWSRRATTISNTLEANGAEEVVRKLALVTADGLAQRTLPGQDDDQSRMRRFISRGNIYFGLGDYDRAARMYKRANDFEDSGHAYLCLGAIQELKHNLGRAQKFYDEATNTKNMDDDDDVGWALLYRGNLLLHEKKIEEAKAKYRVLVTKAPRNFNTLLVRAAAFNNIAFIDLHSKNFDAAQKGFASAQDLAEKLTNEAEDALNVRLANQLLARIHYGVRVFWRPNIPTRSQGQWLNMKQPSKQTAATSGLTTNWRRAISRSRTTKADSTNSSRPFNWSPGLNRPMQTGGL